MAVRLLQRIPMTEATGFSRLILSGSPSGVPGFVTYVPTAYSPTVPYEDSCDESTSEDGGLSEDNTFTRIIRLSRIIASHSVLLSPSTWTSSATAFFPSLLQMEMDYTQVLCDRCRAKLVDSRR